MAEFYAKLASIPCLTDLSAAQRVRLARKFEAASSMRLRDGFGGVRKSDFHYTLEFSGLQSFVRSTLESLLAGGRVAVSPIELPPPVWHLECKGNTRFVEQTWNVTEPRLRPATEFVGLLLLRPFCFGRCPVCGTFFVREGRRRYCSPGCASRGIEAERKVEKREYMRKYMATRRAKELRARRRGE